MATFSEWLELYGAPASPPEFRFRNRLIEQFAVAIASSMPGRLDKACAEHLLIQYDRAVDRRADRLASVSAKPGYWPLAEAVEFVERIPAADAELRAELGRGALAILGRDVAGELASRSGENALEVRFDLSSGSALFPDGSILREVQLTAVVEAEAPGGEDHPAAAGAPPVVEAEAPGREDAALKQATPKQKRDRRIADALREAYAAGELTRVSTQKEATAAVHRWLFGKSPADRGYGDDNIDRVRREIGLR